MRNTNWGYSRLELAKVLERRRSGQDPATGRAEGCDRGKLGAVEVGELVDDQAIEAEVERSETGLTTVWGITHANMASKGALISFQTLVLLMFQGSTTGSDLTFFGFFGFTSFTFGSCIIADRVSKHSTSSQNNVRDRPRRRPPCARPRASSGRRTRRPSFASRVLPGARRGCFYQP